MEIPLLDANGVEKSTFKMMAKVIGKSGIFLKQIKMNCFDILNKPYDIKTANSLLRIEVTKVFSKAQLSEIQVKQHLVMGMPSNLFTDVKVPTP